MPADLSIHGLHAANRATQGNTTQGTYTMPGRTLQPIQSVPREAWPVLIAGVAKLAKSEDTGVGDTVARTIGPIGGDLFKRWWKLATGADCGCGTRQDVLNQMYPYLSTESTEEPQ